MSTILFQPLTGSYTIDASSLDGDGLTISGADFALDYYTCWFIKLTYGAGPTVDEFQITGNTATKLLFTNTIAEVGTYSVEFITKNYLEDIESDMGSTKVSDSLAADKIALAGDDMEKKIYANFKNLYAQFANDVEPLLLVLNLYQIQRQYGYKAIAMTYMDLIVEPGDTNDLKKEDYRGFFKDTIKDALSLLAVDLDQDDTLDNDEKAKNSGTGGLLSR